MKCALILALSERDGDWEDEFLSLAVECLPRHDSPLLSDSPVFNNQRIECSTNLTIELVFWAKDLFQLSNIILNLRPMFGLTLAAD